MTNKYNLKEIQSVSAKDLAASVFLVCLYYFAIFLIGTMFVLFVYDFISIITFRYLSMIEIALLSFLVLIIFFASKINNGSLEHPKDFEKDAAEIETLLSSKRMTLFFSLATFMAFTSVICGSKAAHILYPILKDLFLNL